MRPSQIQQPNLTFQSPAVLILHHRDASHFIDRRRANVLSNCNVPRATATRRFNERASLDPDMPPTTTHPNSERDAALLSENTFPEILHALSDKMDRLPSAETLHDLLDREAKQEKMNEDAVMKMQLDMSALYGDVWTPEQQALYQLLDDDQSDIDSTSAPETVIPAHIQSLDVGEPFQIGYQKSFAAVEGTPQNIDLQDVGKKLKSVQRRREKLALERGDNVLNVVNPTIADPSNGDDSVLSVLNDYVGNHSTSATALSLSLARIIDLQEESRCSTGCALTRAVQALIYEETKFPHVHRPFAGMQLAFLRRDNPPCPRCSRPTPSSQLASADSVCSSCHSEIFVEAEPFSFRDVRIGVGPHVRDAEEQAVQSKAVQMARAAAIGLRSKNMINSQTGNGTGDANQQVNGKTPKSSSALNIFSSTKSGTTMGSTGGNGEIPFTNGSAIPRFGEWDVRASDRSLRTINPIRNLVQNIDMKPNPDKELIKLSVGDPTVYGNLKVSQKVLDKFSEVIQKCSATGYSMSMGSEEARKAVAERYSTPSAPLTPNDVILAAGTSGALEIILGSIANEGDNILIPSPGFPLFRTLAEGYGIECRRYRLNAKKSWEIELSDLSRLRDSRTKAIVINNPSNPCGSVYSAAHIQDLVTVASALKLPILADEVYADMSFSGRAFTSVASMSEDVPVLSVGSISKQSVVPGWRLGWILVHDRNNVFANGNVRKGMLQMTTRMLGPNTPTQQVLPTMLENGVNDPMFRDLMNQLEVNAKFTVKSLSSAKGLRVIEPQGSMYVMAEIDLNLLGFKDDMDFTEQLLAEESVFVLPGLCFDAPGFVRIVFSAPQEILSEAFYRIRSFCSRHAGGM